MKTSPFNTEPGYESFPWPGIKVWRAKFSPTLIDPDKPADVATKNPTDRVLSAIIMLGVDPVIQANCERFFREPDAQLPESEMRERLSRGVPLRPEYCRTRIEWQPGEVVIVPKEWWSSLRGDYKGVVFSGLVPQLILENEENPPPLHPAIAAGCEPEPIGRRKK